MPIFEANAEQYAARITGVTVVDGVNVYSSVEQEAGFDGTYADMLGGRVTSATGNPAQELNNRAVEVGSIVWMKFRSYAGSRPVYEFPAPGAGGGEMISYEMRCVRGVLAKYRATTTLTGGGLAQGPFLWVSNEGCCECSGSVSDPDPPAPPCDNVTTCSQCPGGTAKQWAFAIAGTDSAYDGDWTVDYVSGNSNDCFWEATRGTLIVSLILIHGSAFGVPDGTWVLQLFDSSSEAWPNPDFVFESDYADSPQPCCATATLSWFDPPEGFSLPDITITPVGDCDCPGGGGGGGGTDGPIETCACDSDPPATVTVTLSTLAPCGGGPVSFTATYDPSFGYHIAYDDVDISVNGYVTCGLIPAGCGYGGDYPTGMHWSFTGGGTCKRISPSGGAFAPCLYANEILRAEVCDPFWVRIELVYVNIIIDITE